MNLMTYEQAVYLQNTMAINLPPPIPVAPTTNAHFPSQSHHLFSTSALHPHHLTFPRDLFHAVESPSIHQFPHVNTPSAMPTATAFHPNAYSVPPPGEVQRLQHNQPRSNLEQTPEGLIALADQCIRSSSSSTDAPLTQLRNALLLALEDEACVTKLTGVILAQNHVICELKGNPTMCGTDGTRAAIIQIQLLTKRVVT